MKSQMGALEDIDASKSIELGKKIKRKYSNDSKIQEMVKKVSDRVESSLESSMNSYSGVDVKKLKPDELLSLNKDSCQLMELRLVMSFQCNCALHRIVRLNQGSVRTFVTGPKKFRNFSKKERMSYAKDCAITSN